MDVAVPRARAAAGEYGSPADRPLQDHDERRDGSCGDNPPYGARSRQRQRSTPPSGQPYFPLRARGYLRAQDRRRPGSTARAGADFLRGGQRAARRFAQRQLDRAGQVSRHPGLRPDETSDGTGETVTPTLPPLLKGKVGGGLTSDE